MRAGKYLILSQRAYINSVDMKKITIFLWDFLWEILEIFPFSETFRSNHDFARIFVTTADKGPISNDHFLWNDR
jgi:hypothetical protein